jgi:hypothetical protein
VEGVKNLDFCKKKKKSVMTWKDVFQALVVLTVKRKKKKSSSLTFEPINLISFIIFIRNFFNALTTE